MVVELLDSYKNYFPEPSRDKAFHFHLRNSYLGKFQFGYLQPVKNNEFILWALGSLSPSSPEDINFLLEKSK